MYQFFSDDIELTISDMMLCILKVTMYVILLVSFLIY